jgi:predicted small lipoprotein YifL
MKKLKLFSLIALSSTLALTSCGGQGPAKVAVPKNLSVKQVGNQTKNRVGFLQESNKAERLAGNGICRRWNFYNGISER